MAWMSTIAGIAHVISVLSLGNANPAAHAYMQDAMLNLFGLMTVVLCFELVMYHALALVMIFKSYQHNVVRIDGNKVTIVPTCLFADEPKVPCLLVYSATVY